MDILSPMRVASSIYTSNKWPEVAQSTASHICSRKCSGGDSGRCCKQICCDRLTMIPGLLFSRTFMPEPVLLKLKACPVVLQCSTNFLGMVIISNVPFVFIEPNFKLRAETSKHDCLSQVLLRKICHSSVGRAYIFVLVWIDCNVSYGLCQSLGTRHLLMGGKWAFITNKARKLLPVIACSTTSCWGNENVS